MAKSLRFAVGLFTMVLLYTAAFSQNWPAFVLYQKNGAVAGDQLGASVASAGDVNGDGKADFIIGAYQADPGGLDAAGSAYVYSGATGLLLYQKDGAAADDNLGLSVASAGDVNGDGRADFIIGAYAANPGGLGNAGSAYVYSGLDGSLLYQKDGTALGDDLGWSVASAGDVNGDGRSDFIIGAFNAAPGGISSAGSAYVYSGSTGFLLYQKNGATILDNLGWSVASAGDVNGDGRADFIIGAYQTDPGALSAAGSAYVYSGASGALLFQKNGAAANDNLGYSVASAGDVNGDGRADFIIGAHNADPGGLSAAGSAFVYSGATGGLLYQKNGATALDNLGVSVASAGDVNGDGRADFIVGAYGADPGGLSNAGSAYVYSGASGALLFQKDGAAANDVLGNSVASAGDVNGDGRADFIIGATLASPGGLFDAGSVFLFHSGYGEDIQSITDVGSDQGKQARLRWKSLPGGNPFVNQFAIFRRQDAALARINPPPIAAWANALPPGNWDFVTAVPAFGDTLYQTTVPTLVDSTAADGTQYSVFFVRATSDDPIVYFDSPLDSGYSVDNLAPAQPSNLIVVPTGTDLFTAWSGGGEADFSHFKIYRDSLISFATGTLRYTTSSSYFQDNTTAYGKTYYYYVTATDGSGNEGTPSNIASGTMDRPRKGDLNLDGRLTPSDVALLIRATFLGSAYPAPFSAADLNCSGNLSPTDVALGLTLVFLGRPVTCTP